MPEFLKYDGIVVVLGFALCGCSQSAKQPSQSLPQPVSPNVASKSPAVSNEARQAFVAELDAAIAELEIDRKKTIQMLIELESLDAQSGSSERPVKVEQTAKLGKAAHDKVVKELLLYVRVRSMVVVSPERSKGLAEAIVDVCRDKYLPRFQRSFVAEKVGNRAEQPAANLALEVSDRVVHGWGQRYDVQWMVKDADEYRTAKMDEIAASLALQISPTP